MINTPEKYQHPLNGFSTGKMIRRLVYLVILCLFALAEFLYSGLARRTIVFYSSIEGKTVVEERMLRRSGDIETDIRQYADEVLLGPVLPNLDPLFSRGTKLESLMYRDAVVYADLSESALLPIEGNWDIFRSLLTLNEGIRRNFSFIGDVRLFIGGNEVFFKEFRRIFADPADNSKTAP